MNTIAKTVEKKTEDMIASGRTSLILEALTRSDITEEQLLKVINAPQRSTNIEVAALTHKNFPKEERLKFLSNLYYGKNTQIARDLTSITLEDRHSSTLQAMVMGASQNEYTTEILDSIIKVLAQCYIQKPTQINEYSIYRLLEILYENEWVQKKLTQEMFNICLDMSVSYNSIELLLDHPMMNEEKIDRILNMPEQHIKISKEVGKSKNATTRQRTASLKLAVQHLYKNLQKYNAQEHSIDMMFKAPADYGLPFETVLKTFSGFTEHEVNVAELNRLIEFYGKSFLKTTHGQEYIQQLLGQDSSEISDIFTIEILKETIRATLMKED